ncbi:MAG: hypothetical protein LBC42_01630 [Puniceicoccales bacterium]|jgi:hypothetical protein|nr:hypothetical protein [Puniceicoccales bacterium]
MASCLENLQVGAYERLRNHREFVGVPVLNCRSGDIGSALETWTMEPLGTCVTVLPPLLVRVRRDSARQWSTVVELRVRVLENMLSKLGTRRALEVAECVHGVLSGMALPESNFGGMLLPKGENPWSVRENFPESSRLEIELFFEAQLFMRPHEGGVR